MFKQVLVLMVLFGIADGIITCNSFTGLTKGFRSPTDDFCEGDACFIHIIDKTASGSCLNQFTCSHPSIRQLVESNRQLREEHGQKVSYTCCDTNYCNSGHIWPTFPKKPNKGENNKPSKPRQDGIVKCNVYSGPLKHLRRTRVTCEGVGCQTIMNGDEVTVNCEAKTCDSTMTIEQVAMFENLRRKGDKAFYSCCSTDFCNDAKDACKVFPGDCRKNEKHPGKPGMDGNSPPESLEELHKGSRQSLSSLLPLTLSLLSYGFYSMN